MVRLRVRIRFCKQDDLRLIGHRDLMRCFERIFRRAGLALGMSQGFHPKPRMTFPLPLAVGIAGLDEVMEFELAEPLDAEEALVRLKSQTPPGLILRSLEMLPPGAKKARARSASYQTPVPLPMQTDLGERIASLLDKSSCIIARSGGRSSVDLRPLLEELTLREGLLSMRLRTDQEGSAGPREVLSVLGLDRLETQGLHLTRSEVELCH